MKNGLDWIKENKAFLSIRGISIHLNKKAGMPLQALTKELKGTQPLSLRWIEPINEFVSALRKSES